MWNRKFGRNGDHRKAMLRNMATSVILYGKVETTEAKAKDMRSVVDELITLGKRGDLAARRQAASYIRNVVADEKTEQTVLQKLFTEVAPKYKDRNGGYTRVVKTGVRRGDVPAVPGAPAVRMGVRDRGAAHDPHSGRGADRVRRE